MVKKVFGETKVSMRRWANLGLPRIPSYLRQDYAAFRLEEMQDRACLFLSLGSIFFFLFALSSYFVLPDVWMIDLTGRALAICIVPVSCTVIRRSGPPTVEIVAGMTVMIASIWLCGISAYSEAGSSVLSITSNVLVMIYLITLLGLSTPWALTFSLASFVVQITAALLSRQTGFGDMVSISAISLSTIFSLLFFNIKLETERRRVFVLQERDRVNIERLRADNDELDRISETDELTGLGNRRELERLLGQKSDKAMQVMILDVDHFKRFNDLHGHATGDRVLEEMGRAISRVRRIGDVVCRYGGEEFVVVGPMTRDGGDLSEISERLLTAIREIRVADPSCDLGLSVTASLGSTIVWPGGCLREGLNRADEALYAAKNAGRNRAVHAPPPGAAAA